jgi:hypothetical protein
LQSIKKRKSLFAFTPHWHCLPALASTADNQISPATAFPATKPVLKEHVVIVQKPVFTKYDNPGTITRLNG